MRPGCALRPAGASLQCGSPARPSAAAAHRRHGAVQVAAAAASRGEPDPHALLQVPRGASRRAIRAAYIERIKLLHPDVSASGDDTTAQAAALNAAYERLMEGFDSNSRDSEEEEEWDPLSVFDRPEAEPDRLFVNPFAVYNISPLQWEELQAAARAAEAAGRDPWYALQQQGVQCSEGAFVYLSPAQLAAVEEELAAACATMDTIRLEAAAYFVSDCLLRARVANSRMPAGAGRWG
ncbi:hypothetical protein ABPG75_003846 [Micractinium tetrahymenae]